MLHPKTQLNQQQLFAKKRLGQNFLSNSEMARLIVERANIPDDSVVVEIGPGLGALTVPLARKVRKVYAFEKDRDLIPILEERLQSENLLNIDLRNDDFLKADIKAISETEGTPLIVVGNLPYNISSQVLIRLIGARQSVERAVLMFQKELAERLAAPPGIKAYGRISVMLQYCAHVSVLVKVGAGQFFPRPKIDSSVLGIDFNKTIDPLPTDEEFLFKVIRVAFGKRRKTLRNALTGGEINLDRTAVSDAIERAGIDPIRRPETLSSKDFVVLSNTLHDACPST
jgi:16S rRNA (adenine1518-N6/adenine1519-N6)-dimethyltransferase